MAKVSKVRRKSDCRCHRINPYVLRCHSSKVFKDVQRKTCLKAAEKKEWQHISCSVCMEYPHNAVLLLCSSYDKGCRPYMCATSTRYSNCLEQYKKAYTKVTSTQIAIPSNGFMDDSGFSLDLGCLSEKKDVSELLCPLCRGQVKGWTVVEPARKYFNTKRRTCMQESCCFIGSYKELRKHVREEHPRACPREVDPSLAEKWKRLEREREREDVISTIRSSMPGAIVLGDYVIERGHRAYSGDYDVDDYLGNAIFSLESFGGAGSDHVNSHILFDSDYHLWDEEDDQMHQDADVAPSGHFGDNFASRFTRRHHSRFLSGRLGRRRRRRAANRGR